MNPTAAGKRTPPLTDAFSMAGLVNNVIALSRAMSNRDDNNRRQDLLADMLDRIARRDQASLEQLYDLVINNIYGFAFSLLQDRQEAEEVAEDVVVKVWLDTNSYNPERGTVMAWLLTMCRSRALDRLRARNRRQALHQANIDANTDDQSGEDPFAYIADYDILSKTISSLPEVQKQVLTLAFYRGLTHREISEALNMSLGTVKTHVRRTLNHLRGELGDG